MDRVDPEVVDLRLLSFLQILQILHRICQLRRRVFTLPPLDGNVAAVMMLFEDAQELREFGQAAAELDFDAPAMGQVARAVGGVNMENVLAERLGGVAWGMAIDNQAGGIQIDTQRRRQ